MRDDGDKAGLLMLKAKSDTGKDLLSHLFETAEMAEVQCRRGILQFSCNVISKKCMIPYGSVVRLISFLGGVHDIGKAHPLFQAKIGNPVYGNTQERIHTAFRHEICGAGMTEDFLKEKGIPAALIRDVKTVIYMHHQGRKEHGDDYIADPGKRDAFGAVSRQLFESIWERYPLEPFIIPKNQKNGVLILLEAALIISDWASSSEGVFDEMTRCDFAELESYFEHLHSQAERFISVNHMHERIASEDTPIGIQYNPYRDLFDINKPRPLQKVLIDVMRANAEAKPSLLLIEDLCGGGKTESALYAARYLASGRAGLYMAMPTSATADALYKRFAAFMKAVGVDYNIPLYHSKTWLQSSDRGVFDPEEHLWASNPRQKLFHPSAIGTIDQIIRYSKLVRFGQLGLSALIGKVIVIDEIHDYDAYMMGAIFELIRFCGWAGVPVVACSATLSAKTKRKLFMAYGNVDEDSGTHIILNGKDYDGEIKRNSFSSQYPLITRLQIQGENNLEIQEYPADAYQKRSYPYNIYPCLGRWQNRKIMELIRRRICNGGCLAVIMNTVDEAQGLFRELVETHSDAELFLYHARATEEMRRRWHEDILYRFGRQGKLKGDRPKKAVVVGTPLLEKSLDVDFDFLITELCPADSLIQRMGRYRRHEDEGTIRESSCCANCVDILCSADIDFSNEGKIYNRIDPELLPATYEYLVGKTNQVIEIPSDVRLFIEYVYPDRQKNVTNKAILGEKGLIGSPQSGSHPFEQKAKTESLMTRCETRYRDYETANLLLVPAVIYDEIVESRGFIPIDEIRHIIRTYAVDNIPLYLLRDLLNDNGDWIDGNTELEGILSQYLVLRENDAGVFGSADEILYIDAVYGLRKNPLID